MSEPHTQRSDKPEVIVFTETLPLARSAVDRAAHRRTDSQWLQAARHSPNTKVLIVHDGAVATRGAGGGPQADPWAEVEPGLSLLFTDAAQVQDLLAPSAEQWLFLGESTQPWFAVRVPLDTPLTASADIHWTTLRAAGAALNAEQTGLATTATALDLWHRRHPRCPRCGEKTQIVQAGWVRRCPADGSEHYPRTDPAIIVAVTDAADRLLLGRGATWPQNRYSTLAGYVESGESLEAAVKREIAEEVAITVTNIEYVTSQPWPFPATLMVAYRALALNTDLRPDGLEVADAQWFTRPQLQQALHDRKIVTPGRTSVARALIESWYGSPLPAQDTPGPS